MKKNNLGFTLIELLAVVLIIGIMTSIALPQYRRSVSRAEAMEAMVNLRTLFDSAKRYKAANSEAPMKLNGLDVSFFDATNDNTNTFDIGRFRYTFGGDGIKSCRIAASIDYCFMFYYTYQGEKEVLTCKTENPDGKYGWLCESIGTYQVPNSTNEYYIDKKRPAN